MFVNTFLQERSSKKIGTIVQQIWQENQEYVTECDPDRDYR